MKIFFLNPGGGYIHEYPPLGILYLASVMRKIGHEVAFFDEGSRNIHNITLEESLSKFKPDLIAVSLYTSNILKTFDKISLLKKLVKSPVVAGGPHATVLPEKTMQECKDIDFVIQGEGEITLNELAESLAGKMPITQVPGLYFRDKDKIKRTEPRDFIKDLDQISMPAFDLVQEFLYPYDPIKIGKKVATIMTSRGCPYECTFCAAKAVWGNNYRKRSAKNVVKEIKTLIENYNYDEIYFMDDLFAANSKWLDEFYAQMKKYNINVPWKCLGRVDILHFEDYKKMVNNGCYMVQLGVESGDDDVLKDINKHITVSQALCAFNSARKAGLNTYAFFMFGHQKDTYETVYKTIRLAKKLKPDFISFFSLVPFPGTKVYDALPEDLKYNWEKIVYTSWHKNQLPFKLSQIEPEDLIFFEQMSHLEIYPTLSYFFNNILFSKARRKLIKLKLMFIRIYIRARICQILKRNDIFKRDGRVKKDDNSAFTRIWNDWRDCKDISSRIEEHTKERKLFLEIVSKYIDKSGAQKVLETGCGTAIDSYYLSKKLKNGINFYGTDISSESIEVAGKIGKILESEIQLSVAGVECLRFEGDSFDIVFNQGLMEHFRNPIPAIKEQIRVLKKNGYLIISVPQKYNPYSVYKAARIKKGTWKYGWETEYSYRELRNIGKKLGLELVEVGSHGYGYFQDYGFSIFPLIMRKFSNSRGIFSKPASMVLKALERFERKFGHYFMQNITVVFKK